MFQRLPTEFSMSYRDGGEIDRGQRSIPHEIVLDPQAIKLPPRELIARGEVNIEWPSDSKLICIRRL